jgi:hypothetical protein
MQNAKDSFYMALRTRLAAINPERTILLRERCASGDFGGGGRGLLQPASQ